MTNPTPRPALRKAEDTDVHPAAPAPARRPRATPSDGAAAVSAPARRGGSASTTASDVPAAPAKAAAPAKTGAAAASRAKAAPTSAAAGAPSAKPAKTRTASTGETQSAAAAEIAAAPDLAPAPAPAPKKSKRYQTPPAVPVKGKRNRTGFGGTTSDHMRRSDAPAAPAAENTDKAADKRAKAEASLMTGSLTTVKLALPKKLRKAAEKEAARRGLDLDAVTAELLHTWLTHRA